MSQEHDSDHQDGARVAPLLPLRDIIVFPGMVVPLFVGREKSIEALRSAMDGSDKRIVLCAQRKARANEPGPQDIFEVGTLGLIRQFIQMPDGTVKVLVVGEQRVAIERFVPHPSMLQVEMRPIVEPDAREPDDGEAPSVEELVSALRATFESYVKLNRRIPPEMLTQIAKIEDISRLADTIIAQLALKLANKQRLLETIDPIERITSLREMMQEEIEILQVEKKIRSRVKRQMQKGGKQTDREDKGEARAEGGDGGASGDFRNEIEELEDRIKQREGLSEEARERLDKELKKLKMMSPMSAEATVVRNYIDVVLSMPWAERTEDRLDLKEAASILDGDHYGLERPKERILDYLAVRSLTKTPRGPILCLVGPPGVGKTSLGRSIATSLGREFVRLSLGGVRDEAEIRGHRRTYIGAMPGKIIQAMRKASSANPVFLLDEIDKMSMDFRGDPSSALLEVLDPEQNATFNDHYLDLDYDLSEVLFLCTANDLRGVPGPLRDRMEIIQLPGYMEHEKVQIARQHLVPKQRSLNGLEEVEVRWTDAAIRRVIDEYTREAGVRSLEREVGGVFRKIARRVVGSDEPLKRVTVRARTVPRYLGPARFGESTREEGDEVGLTNGLAWTQFGGVMLVSEVAVMPGKGKLIVTGKLGDVMQESAQAAMSYVRSRALNLGLAPDFHQKVDLHVHFPEGAMPKDGPSAGITMATSLVSCLTRIPVRHDVAMTGEITLRGRVLPIGGLKEKLIAAHRNGITCVLIPSENRKDLREVPASIKDAVEIMPVHHMDEVLQHALRLADPEGFVERLTRPLLPPDVLLNEEPIGESEAAPEAESEAAHEADKDVMPPSSPSSLHSGRHDARRKKGAAE